MRPLPHHPGKTKQRGAALMVMLVIMVMGTAAFLISALSRTTLRIEQNLNSSQILAHTKEEVMGKTVRDTGGQIPGNLYRPDAFASTESPYNYDGAADSGCFDASKSGSSPVPGLPLISSGTNMRCLGRLPWKDYGMSISSPSENDPSGVMPWYAVSANLVDPANVTFNSELLIANPTHPWLTVHDMNGNVLSNRAAIVIIIPDAALPGQSRPTSPLGGPSQYLDSITVPIDCTAPCTPGITYDNFGLDDEFIMGDEHRWITDPNNPVNKIDDSGYQFNDKLIYITIDELMPFIEKRVGNDIKNILNTYYAAWGAFPFSSPFADPSASSFTGQASPAKYDGLLPIGNNVMPIWAGIPTVSFGAGGSYNFCELRNGSTSNSRWRCNDIVISAGETITITGTLNDIGRGFWRPHNINTTNEVQARNASGNTVLSTSVLDNVSVTGSLNPDGSATVVFSAKGKAGYPTLQRIELRDIQNYTTAITPATSPVIPAWLPDNNWHQVAYYSVSPGYAPGSSACNPLPGIPSCLTVSGSGVGNNRRAVVVMTSAALTGQAHPSGTLSDYLEGENATPADFIYENKTRSNIFNDQVIIVAP